MVGFSGFLNLSQSVNALFIHIVFFQKVILKLDVNLCSLKVYYIVLQKFGVQSFEILRSFLDIVTNNEDCVNFRLGFGDFFIKKRETFQTVLKFVIKNIFQRFNVLLIDWVRLLVKPGKIENIVNDVLVKQWDIFTIHSKLVLVSSFEFPKLIDKLIYFWVIWFRNHGFRRQILQIFAVSIIWELGVFYFAGFWLAVQCVNAQNLVRIWVFFYWNFALIVSFDFLFDKMKVKIVVLPNRRIA